MIRRLLALAALLGAGCTTLPPADAPLPPRSRIDAFAVEGRFALNSRSNGQAAQQASGRLLWKHYTRTRETILLMTPLGQGIAEVEIAANGSRLHTDDGREYSAADGEALLREVTGQNLPLRRLADWLRARGQVRETDIHGRPLQITENGWQIRYTYADADPEALPTRLDLRYLDAEQEIDLRLRLETWRTDP